MKVTDVLYGRMLAMSEEGRRLRDIAKATRVSIRTVGHWLSGGTAPSELPLRQKKKKAGARKTKHQRNVTRRRQLVGELLAKREVTQAKAYTPIRRKQKVREVSRQPYSSPAKIARALALKHKVTASLSTVRRDLLSLNKRALRKRRAPALKKDHCEKRVAFCKAFLRRKPRPTIIFTDEKQFDSNYPTWEFQWCGPGEVPDAAQTEQGPPTVTVWGAIGPGGFRIVKVLKRQNLDKEAYQEKILRPALKDLRAQTAKGHVFMQDNARPHCGALDWLKRRGVRVLDLPWPALSCDLNPIEQFWSTLNRLVKERGPYGEEELKAYIEEAAAAVPDETINALVGSFVSRCRKVIAAKGRTIKP